MSPQQLTQQVQYVGRLIQSARKTPPSDIELQAHWARYLCVLIAGMLENGLKLLYAEYTSRCANHAVSRFASFHLDRLMNPKASRFIEVAGIFNPTWGQNFEQFLAINERGEIVNSIMNLRNQIAHGKNAGVSLGRIPEFYRVACEILDYLEQQLAGQQAQTASH